MKDGTNVAVAQPEKLDAGLSSSSAAASGDAARSGLIPPERSGRGRIFCGAPGVALWLRSPSVAEVLHVSEAEARPDAEHLCVRIRTAGQGDRLSRVRRALAVRAGNQPDGRAGARHGPRHVDSPAGRTAGHRHRARFPQLFGLDQDGAGLRADGGGLPGARHRAGGNAYGLFRAIRSRRALRRDGDRVPQRKRLDRREDGRPAAAHLRAG